MIGFQSGATSNWVFLPALKTISIKHGCVCRASLLTGRIRLGPILFDQFLFRIKRCVDTEHPVVQEERSVAVFFHPSAGLDRHSVFDVLVRDIGVVVKVFELPRGNKTASRARLAMWTQLCICFIVFALEAEKRHRLNSPSSQIDRAQFLSLQVSRCRSVQGWP